MYLNWNMTTHNINEYFMCNNKACCEVTGGRLSSHRFPSSFSTDREDVSLDLSPCQAMMSQSEHSPFLEEK